MTLELKTPDEIYQRINDELARIVQSLSGESTDPKLNLAQQNARELLNEQRTTLQAQLKELQENAEWKTFTIAVYGETGAGKSTLIETLRILLQEPTKVAYQQIGRATSELPSLMRISYAVFCLKKKKDLQTMDSKHTTPHLR